MMKEQVRGKGFLLGFLFGFVLAYSSTSGTVHLQGRHGTQKVEIPFRVHRGSREGDREKEAELNPGMAFLHQGSTL